MEDKKRIPVFFAFFSVLLLLILLSSSFVSGLYARYVTKTDSLPGLTVASFLIDYQDNWNTEVSIAGDFAPGETRDYEFSLDYTNCQVDVATTLTLRSDRVLPLTFTYYGCAAEDVETSEPLAFTVTEDGFYEATYTFTPDDDVEDFTIRISWQPGPSDVYFRGLTEEIILTVLNEQTEPVG